ncbi:MAG TPA: fumarylacetoacetate hydrolase family protein, partial [Rhodocyclaceae bacterium]|nr:fumarylacetoacetate hydrolase family protein [Rhodocyclaceae bacterium]
MKYATYIDARGAQRVAAVDIADGRLIDLRAGGNQLWNRDEPGFQTMQDVVAGGNAVRDQAEDVVAHSKGDVPWAVPLDGARLAAPLPVPQQIRDFSVFELHMRQAGAAMARLRAERTGDKGPLPMPADIMLPEVFYKQPIYYKANRFNVVGANHDVQWPAYAKRLDYELELAICIGTGGKNIAADEAHKHIFGYTIFNDFSARDAQEYEMSAPFGPAKGKDFDTGNAFGPWLVTADEIPDPYALRMVARVNGEEWSRGSSSGMVHRFEDMIAHVSREETLYPGELIGSGTVGGGCGLEIGRWLKPGDLVELEIEGIGTLRN